MSSASYWVVIPAAGVGRRMGTDMPKQYLPLAGRTVIEHTLARTLQHPSVAGGYIALGAEDAWWDDTGYVNHPDLVRVDGGEERCHSVRNALLAMEGRVDADDWVLVHDAARPCVRRADIDRLIETVDDHPVGGLLGLPVHDTMKRTDDADQVISTVARERLWHAFTPQMFRYGLLLETLQTALLDGVQVTDEASAIEHAGHRPLMIEGHADNIKITRPEDLALASYYLAQRAGEER